MFYLRIRRYGRDRRRIGYVPHFSYIALMKPRRRLETLMAGVRCLLRGRNLAYGALWLPALPPARLDSARRGRVPTARLPKMPLIRR